MSDYFNATGTIGFTCDVCGRELQGCTWVNGMRFCAKCYQETFGNTNPFEKELRDKIADLETKLEQLQKEKELDNSFWKQECDSLQKALTDKDKEIEELKQKVANAEHERHEEWKTGKEWKWEWQRTNRLLEEANQAKTDLAIAQLEKAKELCLKYTPICGDFFTIEKILDKQIKELKEGK